MDNEENLYALHLCAQKVMNQSFISVKISAYREEMKQ